jgi:hypothetical protein
MNRRYFLPALVMITVVAIILTGCKGIPAEERPWAGFAEKVASKIDVSEEEVLDAFQQAFKDGAGIPGEESGRRIPELTEEMLEQISGWYYEHPEGVSIVGLYTLRYYDAEIQLLLTHTGILNNLAIRVAEILGLGRQVVINAFNQVEREDRDDMHQDALDSLVSRGILTHEQADQYFRWYLARPDTIAPGRITAIK